IVEPSQDMILGNYYITMENKTDKVRIFKSPEEALIAYEVRKLDLHDLIFIQANKVKIGKFDAVNLEKKLLLTTIGKYIFNEIVPECMPYINEPTDMNLNKLPSKYLVLKNSNLEDIIKSYEYNEPFKKKYLSSLISKVFENYDIPVTSKMLDAMKLLGYK